MNSSAIQLTTLGVVSSNETTQGSVKTANYTVATFYWILFIIGVSGNLLLIVVNIWRRSSKQLATQHFLISLTASDLGLLLGNTWIQASVSARPTFIFGRVMCKLSQFWVFTSSTSSIVILTIIGIDRWLLRSNLKELTLLLVYNFDLK